MNPPEPTLVAGRNPVREALIEGAVSIEKILIQKGVQGGGLAQIRHEAKAAQVPVQFVPIQRLNRLAPQVNHQGVLALIAPIRYWDVADLCHHIAPDPEAVRAQQPVLVVLDGIEDPHNYGAILRSAVAAGAAGVIVGQTGMAPLSAVAIKASAGHALRIPIARAKNLAETLFQLKERGYWIAGADAHGTTSVWDMDWHRPLAVVIGSEGHGLQNRVRASCDFLLTIPLGSDVESLNASVAAGILLFAATRHKVQP